MPQSPFAPPAFWSARLFGCGDDTSPDVPAVPDVACEAACEPADFFAAGLLAAFFAGAGFVAGAGFAAGAAFFGVDFFAGAAGSVFVLGAAARCGEGVVGAVCVLAAEPPLPLPFPLPGSAEAVPPTPSEMIIRSSAATTEVSGRARS